MTTVGRTRHHRLPDWELSVVRSVALLLAAVLGIIVVLPAILALAAASVH